LKIYLYEVQKQVEKRALVELFWSVSQEYKLILCLPTRYLYSVYLAMSSSPRQAQNCLKIAKTGVVIIVFKNLNDISKLTIKRDYMYMYINRDGIVD
jgi:hypothetical protein